MIKLNSSLITKILPGAIAAQPETQALAFAVSLQVTKLCQYADGVDMYAAVASLPGNILDVMAAELRTPAYDETYSLQVKRQLVMDSLTYYTKMGTPYAVEQLIKTIFGSGWIEEWWEYSGSPHYFKVHTDNPSITADDVDTFKEKLSTVKRMSSWIQEVILELSTEKMQNYMGLWVHDGEDLTLVKATL